jgi:hypothetical protein
MACGAGQRGCAQVAPEGGTKVAGSVDTGAAETPFGIDLAVGAVVMVAAVLGAGALFPDVPGRLVVVALALAGYTALVGQARAGLATVVVGFLLFNGFLVNRYGELSWDGTTSAWHLGLLALAAGAGLAVRWVRRARVREAWADEVAALLDNPLGGDARRGAAEGDS